MTGQLKVLRRLTTIGVCEEKAFRTEALGE